MTLFLCRASVDKVFQKCFRDFGKKSQGKDNAFIFSFFFYFIYFFLLCRNTGHTKQKSFFTQKQSILLTMYMFRYFSSQHFK